MINTIAHHIGGVIRQTPDARTTDVYNPATGAVTGKLQLATQADVDAAVAAAAAAFPGWSGTAALRRARIMMKFRELLEAHRNELALLITQEHGKVLSDAAGEVTRGIEVVE